MNCFRKLNGWRATSQAGRTPPAATRMRPKSRRNWPGSGRESTTRSANAVKRWRRNWRCFARRRKPGKSSRAKMKKKRRTPFVNSLVPPEEDSDVPFLARLQRASGELRSYIQDAASACVLQILGIVKALHPGQDMEPFKSGNVPGKSEEEIAALEEEARPIAEAVVRRLEF